MQRQYILIGLFTIIFLVIPSCGNALPDNGRVLGDEEYDDTDKSTTPIILSANDDNTTTTVSTTTTTTSLTTTTSNVTADTTPTTTTTLETTTTATTLGGITVYAAMPHSQSRVAIAGMAAFFTFKIGLAMGTVMTSILSSGVRTAFVCFAINPAALGATHPEHLQNLLLAWYKFHPQEFAASGFAMHLPKPAASASVIYTNV
ncbi:unnamed protein product [Adineta steineri]|uniref:Uncharacterized protein n=1 Tax=Adineta steineri TaxID=433720 RepID=A0A814QCC0_9BILA|nr:unnamed protein product [Adineta steineri]